MPDPSIGQASSAAVAAAVADAHRLQWAFVLAATMRVTGDLDNAEEAVQDAYARALEVWPVRGIPANPAAWLTTAAKRRALDFRRRAEVSRRALPKLVEPEERAAASGAPLEDDESVFGDDRLRLIFTCCHPALAMDSRIALTLRMVCGLSTEDVARAFLVTDTTMAARITRAKRKISQAGIPYRIPAADDIAERVEGVLDVVHLVYATGHTAPAGADLMRRELTGRGIELAELLRLLLPQDRNVAGLLALIYLTEARATSRIGEAGDEVLLAEQDRTKWDARFLARGLELLDVATDTPSPGRFTMLAAISAVHDSSPNWESTDWVRIVQLYDRLHDCWPSPVVSLNRAIAIGFARGPAAALPLLDELAAEPQLVRYPYVQAARADALQRLGRRDDAILAYDEAIALTDNERERERLVRKREACGGTSTGRTTR